MRACRSYQRMYVRRYYVYVVSKFNIDGSGTFMNVLVMYNFSYTFVPFRFHSFISSILSISRR